MESFRPEGGDAAAGRCVNSGPTVATINLRGNVDSGNERQSINIVLPAATKTPHSLVWFVTCFTLSPFAALPLILYFTLRSSHLRTHAPSPRLMCVYRVIAHSLRRAVVHIIPSKQPAIHSRHRCCRHTAVLFLCPFLCSLFCKSLSLLSRWREREVSGNERQLRPRHGRKAALLSLYPLVS